MKCLYCEKLLDKDNPDWGYMILDFEQVAYAHLDCIAWDALMARVETEEYLTSVLSF